MEDVGIFYGRLVYLTGIWYFCGHFVCLWPSGIFYGHLGIFFPFWYFAPKKSGSPIAQVRKAFNEEC
jgi:hypothetical protein